MWGTLALASVVALATRAPVVVTVEDPSIADVVVSALVASGIEVKAQDDGQAPLILSGRSRLESVPSELLGPKLHRVDLTLSLRLVRRLDERVLATFELTGQGLAVTRDAAVRHAAAQAVAGLAQGVSEAIAREASAREVIAHGGADAGSGPVAAVAPPRTVTGARGAGGATLVRFDAVPAVDPRDDPRELRARLGTLIVAGAPVVRWARVDARPLARAIVTATIPPSMGGEAARVPVVVVLDLEAVLRPSARSSALLRAWIDGAEATAISAAVDVLPVDPELAVLWRANHRLTEGRVAESRALYAEAIGARSSRVRAQLLLGAAVAARATGDLRGAGALIADCLADHPAACAPWVDGWARAPRDAPPTDQLRWTP